MFGKTLDQHNQHLEEVLQRINELGLRLEPTECEYLKPELEYLGHIITKEGVKPNPEKLSRIQNFRKLETIKNVQSFLGLAAWKIYKKLFEH